MGFRESRVGVKLKLDDPVAWYGRDLDIETAFTE